MLRLDVSMLEGRGIWCCKETDKKPQGVVSLRIPGSLESEGGTREEGAKRLDFSRALRLSNGAVETPQISRSSRVFMKSMQVLIHRSQRGTEEREL